MKKGYLFGVLGASLIFAGCQSDELSQPEQPGATDSDQTLYVNMSISGDGTGMSRASGTNGAPEDNSTDFVDGTGDENKVSNAYFVFYDDNGDVIGNIVQVDVDNLEADETAVGNTVEKSYTSTVAITLRKNEKKPSQVICYINPIDPANLSRPLSVMQTVERSNFSSITPDGRTFAMSNSVYYPEDPDNPGNTAETPQIAVAIPEGALYTSKSAAEAALNTPGPNGTENPNVIKIYVERYATRLNFSSEDPDVFKTATRVYTAGSTNPQVHSVDLTFVPVRWALNAEAKVNYVIKSFREQTPGNGEVAANNFQFTALNNYINDGITNDDDQWVWNNYTFHRSYWGMSPAYFQDKYPEVQSDLRDIDDLKQTYLTYNQLTRTDNPLGYAPTDNGNKYFRETTVGRLALASENPAAAVASVIYVGKYVMKVAGNEVPEGTSFYTYLNGPVAGVAEPHPYVYFESKVNSAESAVTDGESMLKRFFAQSTILYRKKIITDAQGNTSEEYTRLTIDKEEDINLLLRGLQVSEISEAVKKAAAKDEATEENPNPILKLRNNARTLQFKGVEDAEGIYIVNNNAYKEIVADDVEPTNTQIRITDANVALMRQIGYSYFYNLGHGYFNIPVKHLGWYRSGNTQKTADKINWNIVRVGDFGMVRNHTYSIRVSEIVGLANGIGGDDVEIVPPSNTEDYFMAYSVRILKWAVVPQQTVKL